MPVPVTVKTYWPEAVPGSLVPPPPPLLEPPPPPHAATLPSASISTNMPSIARQLRRRAGIPKNTMSARIAPDPVTATPGNAGRFSAAVVAAVVLTVAVPLPLDPNAVVDTVHFGVSPAEFAGAPELSVQLLKVTVPE